MAERTRLLTDAYTAGIDLYNRVQDGRSLCEALTALDGPFDRLEDGYPDWHPAPYSFEGLLRLFIYRELTGESYRDITRYPELAEVFGLDQMPDKSVLSRAWTERFDEAVRAFVTTAAHYAVKEIHDTGLTVPEVRPKSAVLDATDDGRDERADSNSEETTEDEDDAAEFSVSEIRRTTRLACDHGFGAFDSGRGENARYSDTRFLELQTFVGMRGCSVAQGASRFQYRRGREDAPHGDTHLRTVKQFSTDDLVDAFDAATENVLSAIESEASFRRPVTAAIDITTVPYYGDVEDMPMVSGAPDGDGRVFKFATLSIVGQNVPIILAVEPVRENSAWDDNQTTGVHRVVRRLVRRALAHVEIETVVCDREFDSMRVFQTLSNLGVNYLIRKRVMSDEQDVLDQMEADDESVAVERARVDVESGSHPMRVVYVPSETDETDEDEDADDGEDADEEDEETVVFATNMRVGPDEAQAVCERYDRRWQIEIEYKSIKHEFLATTASKDYRVRLFYFVIAVLLHNIWRLTDFLLKAGVGGDVDYAPVLTAGECVEMVSAGLIPPD